MNAEMWKGLWLIAFAGACVFFFGIVLIMGVGGMASAARMVRAMVSEMMGRGKG